MRAVAGEVEGTGLGASVGIAIARRRSTPDELLKAADDAMNDAKLRQKGSFTIRTMEPGTPPDETSRARRRMSRAATFTQPKR